ncbi:MAG TPA: DNA polymerase III subunit gamma/tau [Desulfotomaculum sp.]|nr:MAG: DNA polymerase III, subunits gamma and tau [Desulfotomaculum sp. 46_296]HAG11175.1 DNA polymerase III subunit gamma/tau [Desulfotomaculum sp.]HBY03137.1 DNA polymerase III subunit gamma/tau [Desulfotomaculum sp.]
MAYLALYRKWRPQLFEQIVGQEHITKTLQNALLAEKASHAYLFCGPRGTGKTSTAKVLAKALNCRQRSGAEPCNVCVNCREVTTGASMDVIEIDAASHRGIDEIRELRDKIGFSPASGKYRIYIIDEVHMLTTEAFNALLKTLEEPPSHVVFILATTEPNKVPLTILSRCQRFDFHRLSSQHILGRLQEVIAETKAVAEEGVLYLIARYSEGSLRDALSIWDQVSALGGSKVTLDDIHQLLGTVREDLLDKAARALGSGDTKLLLEIVNSLVEQGKDLRTFVRELMAFLRKILLQLVSPNAKEELSLTERERIAGITGILGREQLLGLLQLLGKTEQEMKWSSQPRILLEVALIRAAQTAASGPDLDLVQRVVRLEEISDLIRKSAFNGYSAAKKADIKEEKAVEEKTERIVEEIIKEIKEDKPPKKETAGRKKPARKTPVDQSDQAVPGADQKSLSELEISAAAERVQEVRVDENPLLEQEEINKAPEATDDKVVFSQISSKWADFLEITKKTNLPIYMYLSKSWPEQYKEGCLTIAFSRENEILKEYLGTTEKMEAVLKLVTSFFKQDLHLRLTCGKPPEHYNLPKREQELSTGDTLGLFGLNIDDKR